jgi:hypothetical protein
MISKVMAATLAVAVSGLGALAVTSTPARAQRRGGGNYRLSPALRKGRPARLRPLRDVDRRKQAAPRRLAKGPCRLVVVGKRLD